MSAVEFISSPEPDGIINLDGPKITAEITFTDAECAEILRQAPEGRWLEFFVRGARSGLIAMGNDMTTRLREAMKFMQTTVDAQVSSFGERMSEKIHEQLGDADKDGYLQRRVQEILEGMSVELKAKMETALPEVFDKQTRK